MRFLLPTAGQYLHVHGTCLHMVPPAALPFPGGSAADCREMLKEKEGVVWGFEKLWLGAAWPQVPGRALAPRLQSPLCCALPAWQFWDAVAAVGLEVSGGSCAAVHMEENNKAVREMFSQYKKMSVPFLGKKRGSHKCFAEPATAPSSALPSKGWERAELGAWFWNSLDPFTGLRPRWTGKGANLEAGNMGSPKPGLWGWGVWFYLDPPLAKWKANFCHPLSGSTKVQLVWSWVHFEATSAFWRGRCYLWWPSPAPLPEGIFENQCGKGEGQGQAFLCFSLHLHNLWLSPFSSFPCAHHFRKFHLCLSASLGDPNNFLFHFPFALISPAPFLGELLFKGVSSVSASPWLPYTAQRTSCIHFILAVFFWSSSFFCSTSYSLLCRTSWTSPDFLWECTQVSVGRVPVAVVPEISI